MSPWILLCVPGTLCVLAGLLYLSVAIERRMLSPRSLIAGTLRARRSTPEHAENLVAAELDRLMANGMRSLTTSRR